jgi:16S rRNA (cytosine1402-N4)-methyltransferase
MGNSVVVRDALPIHVPVLAGEVIRWLAPQKNQVVVDGTLGGGGHTRLLAERVAPDGLVIAVDRDPAALETASRELAGLPIKIAQANYCDVPELLDQLGIVTVQGILLDLGLSSDQLADESRGFSFESSGDLDLRFDPTRGEPAWRLVNRLSQEHLAEIIHRYGEERYSRRIARRIVEQRRRCSITKARDLARLVQQCVPRSRRERIDPATRTFQALRIAVNDELLSLQRGLERLPDRLATGGRIAIISFHSLEDRMAKTAFRDDSRLRALTKKPITASPEELERNRRSRSAKLRVAERTETPPSGSRPSGSAHD